MMKKKQKKNYIPYYLQIASSLRNDIRKGKYKPLQMLPTENDLMAQWSLSRLTVRNALKILTKEGFIYRLAGKGTFVADQQAKTMAILKKPSSSAVDGNRIGLLVPCVTLDVFAGIVRGVEDALETEGCGLLLGNFDNNPAKEKKYIKSFTKQGIAGMIIAPVKKSDTTGYTRLLTSGTPVVFVDSYPPNVSTDMVSTDNFEGSRVGVKRLEALGCKKIGFICAGIETSTSRERLAGYKTALTEMDIEYKGFTRSGEFDPLAGYRMASELLSDDVDGILVANGNLTSGVMQAIRDSKRAVKVASFDEPVIPRDFPFPEIVIVQPSREIGYIAARTLLRRISDAASDIKPEAFHKTCVSPEIRATTK